MWPKILIFSFFSVILAEKVRYDNYTLHKVHPQNENDLNILKDLYETNEGLDFWVPPVRVGDYVSVVSPPEERSEFEQHLEDNNIYSELMLDNIQA